MDDARVVRRLQAVARLQQVPERGAELDGLAHAVLEALAHQQLHADVPMSVVGADVVQPDDVRVDELARELQLLLEPCHQHLRRLLQVEDLERDVFLQLQIERAEDGRHATLADLRLEAIAAGHGRADFELLLGRDGLSDHDFGFREQFRRRGFRRPAHLLQQPGIGAKNRGRAAAGQIRQIAQVRQRRHALLVEVRVGEDLARDHRRRPELLFDAAQALARARMRGLRCEQLLQRFAGVLGKPMRVVQRREQVEDLQLRGVARPTAHVRADEVLEAEIEHVEVRSQAHGDGRHKHQHTSDSEDQIGHAQRSHPEVRSFLGCRRPKPARVHR